MYFVTTKAADHTDGSKFRIKAVTNKRDVARTEAARLHGTVRTQAEIDNLIATNRLEGTTLPGYVAPEPVATTKADHGKKFAVPTPSFLEMAEGVRAAAKASQTIGVKEKFKKRVVTSQAVLDAAKAEFDALVVSGAADDFTKVQVVRWFAAWKSADAVKLQRRDVFALIRSYSAYQVIADATVGTQFQLVRSGKLDAAK